MREARSFIRQQIAEATKDVDAGTGYQPRIAFLQRQNEKMLEAERLMREEAPRDRGDRNTYDEVEAIAKDVNAKLLRGREEVEWWQIRRRSE